MKIGKVAEESGVSIDTIRYYEKRGVLPPPARSSSGYRLYIYTAEAVEMIRFIKKAKGLGFRLDEIRQLARLRYSPCDDTCLSVRRIAEEKKREVSERINDLIEIQKMLDSFIDSCRRNRTPSKCPFLKELGRDLEPKAIQDYLA